MALRLFGPTSRLVVAVGTTAAIALAGCSEKQQAPSPETRPAPPADAAASGQASPQVVPMKSSRFILTDYKVSPVPGGAESQPGAGAGSPQAKPEASPRAAAGQGATKAGGANPAEAKAGGSTKPETKTK